MKVTKKNKSNLSTMHMSNNMSARTGVVSQDKRQGVTLYYASIPIKKDVPGWNQSSSTWRHSSQRYSFSKDSRFKDNKPYYLDILEPQIPSTNTNKTCTFGKGKKKPISQIALRNAKEKPSPDCYNFQEFNEGPRKVEKGKTFGLGWNDYQKAYIQHRQDVYSGHFTNDNPPAQYQVRQKPGKNKRAFSAYGRLKMYTNKMAEMFKHVPGAHHSIKDRHLYNTQGLNERNFAIGERLDLSSPANNNPGAQYQIPGFCDKFKTTKKKNIPTQ